MSANSPEIAPTPAAVPAAVASAAPADVGYVLAAVGSICVRSCRGKTGAVRDAGLRRGRDPRHRQSRTRRGSPADRSEPAAGSSARARRRPRPQRVVCGRSHRGVGSGAGRNPTAGHPRSRRQVELHPRRPPRRAGRHRRDGTASQGEACRRHRRGVGPVDDGPSRRQGPQDDRRRGHCPRGARLDPHHDEHAAFVRPPERTSRQDPEQPNSTCSYRAGCAGIARPAVLAPATGHAGSRHAGRHRLAGCPRSIRTRGHRRHRPAESPNRRRPRCQHAAATARARARARAPMHPAPIGCPPGSAARPACRRCQG